MDTSDYPSLPKLCQLHARLAANSRHVEAVIDSQIDVIEQLFTATTAGDWRAVAEASRYLAELKPDRVGPDVVREARHVFEELSSGPTGPKNSTHTGQLRQPTHLGPLLSACRAVRKP